MQRVLVMSSTRQPLMPCPPARARRLVKEGEASVLRRYPFTIILNGRADGALQPVELKVDPGSKVTGIALVADFKRRGKTVVWGAEIEHRGQTIKADLDARRAIRRSRRTRKTRYRKPRFQNRRRPEGWLPPSILSRVLNVLTWARRMRKFVPLTSISVETVRFDTQVMQNPEVSGVQYQQGNLAGYEVREYLLEKWGRRCAYCDRDTVPLEVEHVVCKAKGGTDRISNLTLACERCNTRKGTQDIRVFLKKDQRRLEWILSQMKLPLKDAAAVNATRYAIGVVLKNLCPSVSFWSGGRTKWNRSRQGYPKAHWIDAACVGESGAQVKLTPHLRLLRVKAVGHGSRQMCCMDRFGFPRTGPKGARLVEGFRTGDMVRLDRLSGKYRGRHVGPVTVRTSKMFDVKVMEGGKARKITAPAAQFTKIFGSDGYVYA